MDSGMDKSVNLSKSEVEDPKAVCVSRESGIKDKLPKIKEFFQQCVRGEREQNEYLVGVLEGDFSLLDCIKFLLVFFKIDNDGKEIGKMPHCCSVVGMRPDRITLYSGLLNDAAMGERSRILKDLEKKYPNLFNFDFFVESSYKDISKLFLGSKDLLSFLEARTDGKAAEFASEEHEIKEKVL